MSPKRAQRREKFRKIGEALSAMKPIGDPDVNDYFTGKPSKFHVTAGASDLDQRIDIRYGPTMKTPQWVRTTR